MVTATHSPSNTRSRTPQAYDANDDGRRPDAEFFDPTLDEPRLVDRDAHEQDEPRRQARARARAGQDCQRWTDKLDTIKNPRGPYLDLAGASGLLTPFEFMVLYAVVSYMGRGGCWASLRAIAFRAVPCGDKYRGAAARPTDRANVGKVLHRLCVKGFLEIGPHPDLRGRKDYRPLLPGEALAGRDKGWKWPA